MKPSYKQFIMTEMPKYIDSDYEGLKPMKTMSMRGLENRWKLIETFPIRDNHQKALIYINERETMAVIGTTRFYDDTNSWELDVATYMKLEKTSGGYLKVIGVYADESIRLEKYTLSLYYSLVKNGYKISSDNEQYQGAKPLWKALSKITEIEVYNEITHDTFDYNVIDNDDNDVWSKDDSKKHLVLRNKQ